jgi:spermidine/putrescine-binding protein
MKKRIRVWADIHSKGLFYDVAIMSDEERENNNGLIKELDRKGLSLMQKISAEWTIEKSTGSELTFVY